MIQHYKTVAAVLFAAILFIACGDGEGRVGAKEFYFPVEDLKEGKVYEYRSVDNDTLPARYWYYMTMDTDTGKYLVSSYYDYAFVNRQLVVEKIDEKKGAFATQYKFLSVAQDQETSKIVDVEIVKNYAFPFHPKPETEGYPMELKFNDPDDPSESIRLVRMRKLVGDTIYSFDGEDHQALLFEANELREFTHPDKGDFDAETQAFEIYAEGIGLIARKYSLGDVQFEYALKRIFDMKEFENMAYEYWGKEFELSPF